MPYLRLIKWRLSLAVAFSATAGFFLVNGELSYHALICFLGVFLLSGGAAGINQLQERKIDLLMDRTAHRPLPSQNLKLPEAIIFTCLCIISGSILLFRLNWIPALLALVNILIYNVLYTPLKRVTIYAIIPGGLVGAIPPMIGWTAAGGSLIHPSIIFLASLMFLWQIPHFWLLVIRYGKDYEKAGLQTISQYLDENQIKRLVFFWILISSVFLASYPIFQIHINIVVGILMFVLNIIFILAFYWYLFRNKDPKYIKPAFILTNIFLTVILLMLIINSLL
mgnify:FL=1